MDGLIEYIEIRILYLYTKRQEPRKGSRFFSIHYIHDLKVWAQRGRWTRVRKIEIFATADGQDKLFSFFQFNCTIWPPFYAPPNRWTAHAQCNQPRRRKLEKTTVVAALGENPYVEFTFLTLGISKLWRQLATCLHTEGQAMGELTTSSCSVTLCRFICLPWLKI